MRIARVLFARVPQLGHVKTRLAQDLSANAAFEIYRWLLRVQHRVFSEKPEAGHRYTNYVYYSPDISRLRARLAFLPDLKGLKLKFRQQCPGDLGERLKAATSEVLKHHDIATIWGADVPTLPASIFTQSAALAPQSVITLARDGGYAFISLARKTYSPQVFDRIRWSTVNAGSDQLRALTAAGIEPVIQGRVADLDRAHDLTRVIAELEARGRAEDLADLVQTLQGQA